MDLFVVIGLVGVAIVVATLVFGDVLDGLLEGIDLGSGLFSAPVIGGFLAAFGFGTALTQERLGSLATVVGVGAGVVFGGAALLLTRSVMRMRTDATPRAADLAGRLGVVLTPVPSSGYGRVRVTHLGQQLHLSARADRPLPAGTQVVVVDVVSPTAVVVTPADLSPAP